jgi:hypothetical protein
MSSFRNVKIGDRVKRVMGLGGPIMELVVTGLTDDLILCGTGSPEVPIGHDMRNFNGWKFNRDQGYEVDEELGWGVPRNDGMRTGSYLQAQ